MKVRMSPLYIRQNTLTSNQYDEILAYQITSLRKGTEYNKKMASHKYKAGRIFICG